MRWTRRLLVVGGCAAAVAGAWMLLRPRVPGWWASHKLTRVPNEIAAHDLERARGDLLEVLDLAPGDVQARTMLADLELGANRLDHAFLHYQALTELQPGSARAWLGLARVRIAADQPEEAEAALTRALEAGLAGEPDIRLRAQLRYRFGRYHGALLDAERAVRLDPRDAQAWLVAVRSAARLDGASAVVDRAVASGIDRRLLEEPDASKPLPRRGGADRAESWPGELGEMIRNVLGRMRAKDWTAADALAAQAGRTWPATLMGPWLAGLVLYQRGDLAPAERSFREALRRSPRSHRVVTNLIPIWSREGGALHAGDELSGLVASDPGFVYPLQIAARAYLEGDQPARAEAALRRELEILPDSPTPFHDLARFDLEIDRGSEAIAVCERGLARFPHDAELNVDAARAAALLGDRARAIEGYEAALAERPDDQVAAAEVAALLVEDRGQRDRALALVRWLERDAPIDPDVLGAMGIVLLESDPVRARRYLEPASAAAPADARLHYQLALALRRTGDVAHAIEQLGFALKSGKPFRGEAEARRLLRELAP
ncbi:MAG: tetratricopeptide repeat protein [Myxococcales bacterium]